MPTPNPARRSPYQQLLLPLELPTQPTPRLLPPDTLEVASQQVWPTLAPLQQTQARQTLIRIIQEVLRHADQSSRRSPCVTRSGAPTSTCASRASSKSCIIEKASAISMPWSSVPSRWGGLPNGCG
jgi:hypothetical protein